MAERWMSSQAAMQMGTAVIGQLAGVKAASRVKPVFFHVVLPLLNNILRGIPIEIAGGSID